MNQERKALQPQPPLAQTPESGETNNQIGGKNRRSTI